MDDKALFTKILGLRPPWFIKNVVVNDQAQQVDIYVDHEPDIRVRCPVCDQFYGLYHHAPERVYRHLDTCQMRTFIKRDDLITKTCDQKGGFLKRDAITPLSLLSIAIIFIVYSLKYKFGSLNAPGVGLFPTVSAAGLAGLSLFLLWKDTRSVKKEGHSQSIHESGQEPIQGGKLCALISVMVLFALLHSVLGFWLCVFAAMVVFQRIAGVSTWKWSFLGGIATMAIGYLVFERWMGAHFPEGILETVGYWLN